MAAQVPTSDLLPAGIPGDIAAALSSRGVVLELMDGEEAVDRDRRLETSLMALFRDMRWDAAYEVLYRRSRAMILSWILHLLRGRAQSCDAAELLQDTYVNVYRYAGGFRDEGKNSFRGWARTIAANVVRRASMRRGLITEPMPEGGFEPADDAQGPEQSALVREEQDDLKRAWMLLLLHYAQAFGKLSDRDQSALTMIEVEGLSYQEAGEKLGVGRSNMKMIMFRSRKRIRAHILRAMQGDERPVLRRVS